MVKILVRYSTLFVSARRRVKKKNGSKLGKIILAHNIIASRVTLIYFWALVKIIKINPSIKILRKIPNFLFIIQVMKKGEKI